jgi:hypothetical protein
LRLNNRTIMTKETAIKLFQDQRVRVHWDDEQEKWYFSIIDVIGVLLKVAIQESIGVS